MNWNGFCLYALMCFLSPASHLDSKNGLCSYYNSEDVAKKSVVIDVSKQQIDTMNPSEYLTSGPLNTILIHAPQSITVDQQIHFSFWEIEYDHMIVLNEAMPMNLCPNWGQENMTAISLTVLRNSNLLMWNWLKCAKFKYVRIDSCKLLPFKNEKFDDLILSEYLITLTLVNIENLDQLNGLDYELAPNLRELSVNHFRIQSLKANEPAKIFHKLKRLNLANNQIETVSEDFFNSMPNLEEIIIEGNAIKTFDYNFNSKLKRLLIDENPLEGDEVTCKFLQSNQFVIFRKTKEICKNLVNTKKPSKSLEKSVG